ncbi:MFS transporter [Mesorhizobium sp. B1-1-5]|nr:MFS transporter [Mesorhizobium sp. B1-1-5]
MEAAAPIAHNRRVLVTALGITQILAWGSSYYLPAVLAVPIAKDTGWSLAWVIAGLSCGLLLAGLVSPVTGRLIQRHGGRPVLAASSLLLAAAHSLLATATDYPLYLAAWLAHGLGHVERPLRCRLRHTRPPLWTERARRHHQPDAFRRLCQHHLLADQRLPCRAWRLAHRLPCLCRDPFGNLLAAPSVDNTVASGRRACAGQR